MGLPVRALNYHMILSNSKVPVAEWSTLIGREHYSVATPALLWHKEAGYLWHSNTINLESRVLHSAQWCLLSLKYSIEVRPVG